MKTGLLIAGGAVTGAALGAAFNPLGGIASATSNGFSEAAKQNIQNGAYLHSILMGGAIGTMGAGILAIPFTLPESSKLRLDEQNLQARAWGGEFSNRPENFTARVAPPIANGVPTLPRRGERTL